MKHVVMFSGGIGSWMTAKRVAERHGTHDLVLLFADVKGNSDNPHVGEDEDTYRFIVDAHRDVGGELVFVEDGRNIWDVFKDDRFLGNSRLANCSKYLKQIPCRKWLDTNCDPQSTIHARGKAMTVSDLTPDEMRRAADLLEAWGKHMQYFDPVKCPWSAEELRTEANHLEDEL